MEIPEKYSTNIDIMIEAKMKEQAIFRLYQKYPLLSCLKPKKTQRQKSKKRPQLLKGHGKKSSSYIRKFNGLWKGQLNWDERSLESFAWERRANTIAWNWKRLIGESYWFKSRKNFYNLSEATIKWWNSSNLGNSSHSSILPDKNSRTWNSNESEKSSRSKLIVSRDSRPGLTKRRVSESEASPKAYSLVSSSDVMH